MSRHGNHGVAMAAQDKGLNVFHADVERFSDERAKACPVKTPHADDAVSREPETFRHIGHGIQRVADHNQRAVGGIFRDSSVHSFTILEFTREVRRDSSRVSGRPAVRMTTSSWRCRHSYLSRDSGVELFHGEASNKSSAFPWPRPRSHRSKRRRQFFAGGPVGCRGSTKPAPITVILFSLCSFFSPISCL